MNHFVSIAIFTYFLGIVSASADSNPSFFCSENLSQTEHQICDHVPLGDLDREMSRLFFQAREQANGADRDKLNSDQALWLLWRNTCDDNGQCIRRRYDERIIDLSPTGESSTGLQDDTAQSLLPDRTDTTDPNQIVDRRVTTDRFEVELADGTVRWEALNGSSSGTISPDGTEIRATFGQSRSPDFPSLPGTYASWGESLETKLLGIINQILSPADVQAYRNLIGSKPYSSRINDHIRVIDLMTTP